MINGFRNKKINLLVNEFLSENILKEKIKAFDKLTTGQQLMYKHPYLETTLLTYELVNLEYKIMGTNVRINEKSDMRKDRYSSLAYNYWVQCQLEREELNKRKNGFDVYEYAEEMKKLNRKPIAY